MRAKISCAVEARHYLTISPSWIGYEMLLREVRAIEIADGDARATQCKSLRSHHPRPSEAGHPEYRFDTLVVESLW